MQGRIQGVAPGTPPAPFPEIGKKYEFFLRKIVIFPTKYPQKASRLPPLCAIFLSAPPNLKSWIRPCDCLLFEYFQGSSPNFSGLGASGPLLSFIPVRC